MLAEGPHAVSVALGSPRHTVTELFVAESFRDRSVLRAADAAAVPITVVTERVFASLSETVTPQGVVAVVGVQQPSLADVLAGARLVVVLDGIADPGNAGTVIRTADAAGADAVVFTRGSVDPGNGKCVRASAGSVFTIPVVTGVEIGDIVGLQLLAATLDGDDDLDALADSGVLTASTAWLFGSEAHGLSSAASEAATRRVRIPMPGGAESLNLAAAAAVCLFASARAQR